MTTDATNATLTPPTETPAAPVPQTPAAPAPLTEAQIEAKQREAFDRVMAEHNGTAQPRNDKGQFEAKAPEKAEEKPAEEPKAQEKPETKPEEKSEPEIPPEDAQRYRRALLRDGWEESDISELSPEKLAKLGTTRASRQEKLDRRMEELKSGAAKPAPAEAQDDDDDELETPTDGAAEGDPTRDDLDEWLDDDGKKRLKSITDAHEAKVTQTRAAANAIFEKAAELALSTTRERLESEYGLLKDPAKLDAVLAEMGQLDPQGKVIQSLDPARLTKLMRTAIFSAFGDTLKQHAHAKAVEANRERRQGNPDTRGTSTAVPKSTPTTEDKERLAFQAVQEFPDNPMKAQKRLDELLAAR